MRTIAKGGEIPLGLSRWKDVIEGGWQLRLPIFIWRGPHWDQRTDTKQFGWRALNILIKTQFHGFNFRWGWVGL